MSTLSAARSPSARPASASERFLALPVRTIDIGHSRVAYRVVGEGPDLVFIHGWPLDSATFRELAPLLASSFRCHLFDLPGAGATEVHDPSVIALGKHAASARAVLETLGLPRYAILAHDSGGMVARMLAADDPRVVALVLGDTEVPNHMSPVLTALKTMASLPLIGPSLVASSLRSRTVRRSPLGFGSCFQDLNHLDGEFHDLFVAPLLRDKKRAAQTLALLQTFDLSLLTGLPALHARIRCPTQLIWGTDDPIFPLARARAMVSQFAGGAQLTTIEGGKVFVHEERPELFANFARPFLLRAFAEARVQAAE